MIGGDRSFSLGGYANTPVAEILPVKLPNAAGFNAEPFNPRVTVEGQRHPILKIGGAFSGVDLASIASSLPSMRGENICGPLKNGAVSLLVHPFLETGGGPMPTLAVADRGRGRVLSLLTNGLWRWVMGDAETAGNPAIFDRFWKNALRWLTRDPETNPLELRLSDASAAPGEIIDVEIKALNRMYKPAAGAKARMRAVNIDDPKIQYNFEAETGADGRAVLQFGAAKPGAYRLEVEVMQGQTPLGHEERVAIISYADRERTKHTPRRDLMRKLASETEGSFHSLSDGDPASFSFVDPQVVRVDKRKHIPIWNLWIGLAAILLVAAVEWYLRRRWGFL